MTRLKVSRVAVYYTAYLWDKEEDVTEDIQMPRRVIDEELDVPMPTGGPVENEWRLARIISWRYWLQGYRINPGLHMTLDDIKQYIDTDDAALEKAILGLEEKGYVMVLRNRKGIQLVKATYDGLKVAHPKEYYKWFPTWATEDRLF